MDTLIRKVTVRLIFQTIVENIDSKHHEVEVINLNEENFDPVLRYGYRKRMEEDSFILRSQELIQWADHFIFVYPIWWSSMPSLMKGWIDRVFTPGIAYSANDQGSFYFGITSEANSLKSY